MKSDLFSVIGLSDTAFAQSDATSQKVVTIKTHQVDHISADYFWVGHVSALILLFAAIILIYVAPGPRRKDSH